MISSLPATRPGSATARFYKAFHDLTQLQPCSRPRQIHTLLRQPRPLRFDRLGVSHRNHRPILLSPGSRRLVVSPLSQTKSGKSSQAYFNLNSAEYQRFRELDLEHRIHSLSRLPCVVKAEEQGDRVKLHLTGINRSLRGAIKLVTSELGLPAVQNDAQEEDVNELQRQGLQDIPPANPFAEAEIDEERVLLSNTRPSTRPVAAPESHEPAPNLRLVRPAAKEAPQLDDYDVIQVSRLVRVPQAIANLYPRELETRFMTPGSSLKQTRVFALDTAEPVAGKSQPRGTGNDTNNWTRVRITGPLANVDYVTDRLMKFVNREYQKISNTKEPVLPQPTQQLEDSYKTLMRSVVSPVAVITAFKSVPDGSHKVQFAQCVGATISSLSSVCIKPAPILSFNLHENSGTASSIADSSALTVHLLTADKHGEEIARVFSDPSIARQYERFQAVDSLQDHRVSVGDDKGVFISGPGVLARAHCHLIRGKTVSIGDHLVMFANVVQVDQTASSRAETAGRTGLTFGQSTYLRSQKLDGAPPAGAGGGGFAQNQTSEEPLLSAEKSYIDPFPDGSDHTPNVQSVTQDSRSSIPSRAPESETSRPHTVRESPSRESRPSTRKRSQRSKEEDNLLDEIAMFEEPPDPSPTTIERMPYSPSSLRSFSTSTRRSTRFYSTAPPTPDPEPTPFLTQTVAQYLGHATMPRGRWQNARVLAELDHYGPERIRAAIQGGTADAPSGSQPGGRTNSLDMRIRKLIAQMHDRNKRGHVSDEVMEALVLGKREGGTAEKSEEREREEDVLSGYEEREIGRK